MDWGEGDRIHVVQGSSSFSGLVVHVERDEDGDPVFVVAQLGEQAFQTVMLANYRAMAPKDLN